MCQTAANYLDTIDVAHWLAFVRCEHKHCDILLPAHNKKSIANSIALVGICSPNRMPIGSVGSSGTLIDLRQLHLCVGLPRLNNVDR